MDLVVSVADFRAIHPEFNRASDDQVRLALYDAENDCSAPCWGRQRVRGILLRAAHLIAINPHGQQARLTATTGQTVHGIEFEKLRSIVAAGVGRVL